MQNLGILYILNLNPIIIWNNLKNMFSISMIFKYNVEIILQLFLLYVYQF